MGKRGHRRVTPSDSLPTDIFRYLGPSMRTEHEMVGSWLLKALIRWEYRWCAKDPTCFRKSKTDRHLLELHTMLIKATYDLIPDIISLSLSKQSCWVWNNKSALQKYSDNRDNSLIMFTMFTVRHLNKNFLSQKCVNTLSTLQQKLKTQTIQSYMRTKCRCTFK